VQANEYSLASKIPQLSVITGIRKWQLLTDFDTGKPRLSSGLG